MHKEDITYIDHAVSCIRKIRKYMKGVSKQKFINDDLLQDAVIRNIEIIGEASRNISLECKNKYAHIPWKEITGMRDKLIHHYMGVDVDVIWSTIKQDIPMLEKELKAIKMDFNK
ncbi:MAG: DUF86 domain-containing protein [Bacteroidales bacterium]|nr:DUF86 domain-containing protein [Bacteroidales bacterium]